MQIATVIGARPQFVKASVVSRALKKTLMANEVLIHTGQHYDANMSQVFFEQLDIPVPSYNLGVGGGTHGQNTGRMIEELEAVLIKEKPDCLLVYGDTDSTLAGAIAASKLQIPVAHIEAGLRSFNRRMPEEINRVLTDHVANLLFTPTVLATQNLINEGISINTIKQVGDVMYDAALYFAAIAEEKSIILKKIGVKPKSYILTTVHRAENTDDPVRLKAILEGLSTSRSNIVWPMHPRTRERLKSYSLVIPENVIIIEPIGYLDMVLLEKNALLIATDSGGVQKEAYFYGIPCITLRDETEWLELVDCSMNYLVGANAKKIAELIEVITAPEYYKNNLYGDGKASNYIVELLLSTYG